MGLGSLALLPTLAAEARRGAPSSGPRHHIAKANRCIFLLMEGGPSHIDTFDPKPALDELHLTASAGKRRYVRSPFRFRRAGRLGIEINEGFRHLAGLVDDICFYRGLQAASANHTTALSHIGRGNRFGGDPASPFVADLSREPETTREMYGVGDPDREVDAVARRCLLARRMIEAGEPLAQVTVTGWDSHDDIEKACRARIKAVDKPVAALLKDLKRTGLLEETLVVWAGEFGRSPDNFIRGDAGAWGRDHNASAMTIWLAGGGVPRGKIVGATDELGARAVEAAQPVKNLQATLAHLLGVDDANPPGVHTGGELIEELVA